MADDSAKETTLLETARFHVVEASLGAGRPKKAIIRHPGSVCIIPVLNDGRVCLIRNFRISVDETLIEIPAGTQEPPEPPEECAQRELAEETGFQALRWTKLGELFLAPGLLDERAHVFLAEDLTAGPQQLEADESIENFLATWPQIDQLINDGQIQDAKTLAALSLWRRHIATG